MKTLRSLVLLLTACLLTLTPRPAQAREEVSFDFFYDSLSPYGEWVEVADYGFCWRPTNVDREWRPYADGYWAFTDAGWTWVSYEDFGGIVYHYGRWVNVEDAGWCWVPEYEWGPAWVSWRQSDDYVGWAPLPPEARWQPAIGISIWVDRQYDIGPAFYNFCRARDFGAPALRPVIIDRRENVTIIRRTVNITNITYNTSYGNSRVIYNGGLNYEAINQRSERRIPALKLVENTNRNLPGSRDWDRDRAERDGHRRNFNPQTIGNQLVVTAPTVRPPANAGSLKPKVTKVFTADKVMRGWSGVKNEDVRRELKQEMQRQTKGLTPETAPAKPMVAADVKIVPQRADPQAPSPVATREKRDRPDRKEAEVARQPPATPTAPIPPTAAPEGTARERDRDLAPQKPPRPVAADSGLKPFNPLAETNQKPPPDKVPTTTPPVADPRVAKPGEEPARMRDQRKPSIPNAEGTKQRDGDAESQSRATLQRRQVEAAAQQQEALTEQHAARQRQAAAVAEQQREVQTQRNAEAQRQQMEAATRQKMQAGQEKAARQQAEAVASQQQIKSEQRAAQEAARAQGMERARQQQAEIESRRRLQPQPPATEPQPRREVMEKQPRAGQDAPRQQAERAVGEQAHRPEDGRREQMHRQPEAPRPQRAPEPAAVAPAQPGPPPQAPPLAPETETRGKGKDRNN